MSLPVLVAIVAVGIAVIVLAIHLTGGSKVALIESEAQAKARFAEDFADQHVSAVHLTADRHSAFLELGRDRTGLVHSIGARFLTRLLLPSDIASCRRAGDSALLLRTADITFSGGNFQFADSAAADRVALLLSQKTSRSDEAAA